MPETLPQPKKILIVEDEENVGSTLSERLTEEGFDVTWAKTRIDASGKLSSQTFDLAILDIGLPDGSGYDVAEEIKLGKSDASILFLTAYGQPEDRLKGLESGAEDYVVKPFHFRELLIRIRKILERTQNRSTPETIQIGKAEVCFDKFQVTSNGDVHTLSQKECHLLRYLVSKQGIVVSRDEILNEVWSMEEYPSPRTVDNFVVRMRKLVEENPESPQVILSIRGVGYKLV